MQNDNIKIVPLNRRNGKNLKGFSDYENIRINSYYFKMEKIQNNKTIDFNALLKSCEDTISYFKSVLKVVPEFGKLYIQQYLFIGLKLSVPTNHYFKGLSNTDFMLYFSEMDEKDCGDDIMVGKTYQSDYFDKHPEVGLIQFCPTKINLNNIKYFETILKREILHSLGFSSSTFDFLKSKYKLKNDNKYILSSPLVKSAVQQHFNCENLEGAYFEDQNDNQNVGDFWEYTLYKGEIMIGDIKENDKAVLSNLTLSLLEDTGWYKVNWNYNEFLSFGYNQGCDMGNMKCTTKKYDGNDNDNDNDYVIEPVGEYCLLNDDNKQICSVDYNSLSLCTKTSLSNCPIISDVNSDECDRDSKCHRSSLGVDKNNLELTASCYKIKCYSNKRYLVYACPKDNCISVDDYKVNTCSKDGDRIRFSGFNGVLVCNDPKEMCANGDSSTTSEPTTVKPTTTEPTTPEPTTVKPTTPEPTTIKPTTPTTFPPTTPEPTTTNDNAEFIGLMNLNQKVVYFTKPSYLLDMNHYNINDIRIKFNNLKGKSTTDDNKVETNVTLLYRITDSTTDIPTIELFPDFTNRKIEKINFNIIVIDDRINNRINPLILKNNGLFRSINQCYFINIHINIMTDITIDSLNGLLSSNIESSTMMNVGISFNNLNIILYNNNNENNNYYGLLTNSISNSISTEYSGLYVTGNKLKIKNNDNNNNNNYIGVLIGVAKNVNLSYSFITLQKLNITNTNNNNRNNNKLLSIGGLIGNSINIRGILIYYRCFTLISNGLYIYNNNNNNNVYYGNFVGSESISESLLSSSLIYNTQIYESWIYCKIRYIDNTIYGNIIGLNISYFEMYNTYIRVYNIIKQTEYIPKIGLLFGSIYDINTIILFNNYISYIYETDFNNDYNNNQISEVYNTNQDNNIKAYFQSVYILSNVVNNIESIYGITVLNNVYYDDVVKIISEDNNRIDNNLLVFYNITKIADEIVLYYNQMPYFDSAIIIDPSKSFIDSIGIEFTISSSTSSISTINYVSNKIYIKSILSYYKESNILLLPSPSYSEDGYIHVNITIKSCYKLNKQHQFTISSPDNNQYYYDYNSIIIGAEDCNVQKMIDSKTSKDINDNDIIILNFISNNVVIQTNRLVLYSINTNSNDNDDGNNNNNKSHSKGQSNMVKLIITYIVVGVFSFVMLCIVITSILLVRARIRDKKVVGRYDYKAKRRYHRTPHEEDKDVKNEEEKKSLNNVKFEKLEEEKE